MARKVIGLVFAFVLLIGTGCQRQVGVAATGPGPEKGFIDQSKMPFKVNNWMGRLTNALDGEPSKRKSAAVQVARHANDPEMTGEMKAQLADALKKMIEAEPMSEADNTMQQEIIEAGNKALATLQGGSVDAID